MDPDTAVLDRPMARKKAGRPKSSDRDDVTVKIDRELKVSADYVAAKRRMTLAQYLTELLKPVVEADFAKESKRSSSN